MAFYAQVDATGMIVAVSELRDDGMDQLHSELLKINSFDMRLMPQMQLDATGKPVLDVNGNPIHIPRFFIKQQGGFGYHDANGNFLPFQMQP